ncbi:TonB-dependent receptor [Caulobacter henricii]|uniref:TonB-dependent receptor n=1 Tax=Caulobacter henricii TaxID=69395 RepID=A0A0N7JHZ8_9CAUL|nr:TonB-dependent receptor [Caulobacter henricii]ALL14794.1 TonB-dependent receptor [Caulobacter henricii]
MRSDAWRRWVLVPTATCAIGFCATASAAEQTFLFDIPRKPLKAALIDLAIQGGVSISTQAASSCAADSRLLRGRYSLKAGLEVLLAGTGCGFRMIDAHAVQIVRLPPSRVVVERPSATPSGEPYQGLPELVVLATRRPTPADRLAYAVSALGGSTIAGQGLRDVGDLAMAVPSMTVTNLGAGRNKIMLRGLSDGPLTGRTQAMVGLYLDDTRLTYNAPDPDLLLIDMAQVEVLRGPQGALYGAGSLGGILHLVTEPPNPTGFDSWVSGSAATTKGGAASGLASGLVNLPLFQGQGAVRVLAYSDIQGGYVDDAGLGLKNVNRTVRSGARLLLRLDLDERWTLTAGAVGQAINAEDTQYALASEAPYTRRNQIREPHDNDFVEVHLGLRGDLEGVEARWTVSAVRHDITSRYDASSAPPVSLPPGPAAFDDQNLIQGQVMEGSLASLVDGQIQWLAGVFLARTRQDNDLALTRLAAPAMPVFAEARRDALDEAALFGEAVLPLGPSFSATLGGRLFLSRTRVVSVVSSPARPPSVFDGKLSRSGFAPKIVLTYALSPHALVYAQAAEGYRAAGFNTSGPPGQVFTGDGGQPRRVYRGDELWSLELGARLSALDGRARLHAALFQTTWKDIQSDQLLPSGLAFTANIGDGRNLGLELEGTYQVGRLKLGGSFLINGPELENANPAFPARSDQSLAGVPGRSGGITAHYDWSLSDEVNLELDARYAYVGHSRLTFDAATAPTMGSYGSGRLALGLAAPRWRLTAALDNPANARGDTFAYGNPFTLRRTHQITPPRPRTLSLTLRVDR